MDDLVVRTILISDVRGYTRFTNERGVPAAARLAERFADIATEVVSQYDGRLLGLRGDEAAAAFATPAAALSAALELQDRCRREASAELPLYVGAGVAIGELAPARDGYRGTPLNLAARLCSLASAGDIFTTQETVGAAGVLEGVAYVARGRVRLKGFPNPVPVVHVLREADLPENFPPLASPIAAPTNIPSPATPFVGREEDIEAIRDLVREARLVVLTGTGGSGKTRLAVEASRTMVEDFERGVYLVSLDALTDPNLLAATIAAVLKVPESPGVSVEESVLAFLRDRQMLLLLDNFEQVLPAARLVSCILENCPDVKVVVTSRVPLHLSEERLYPVAPMQVPRPSAGSQEVSANESVALFLDRARAVLPAFTLTEQNVADVRDICRALDGLPLALTLAAPALRLFPAQSLLKRLRAHLPLPGTGAQLPPRQRTMKATIDWSYGLLGQGERELFAALGIFAGSFGFEAVEAIAGGGDVVNTLMALVDAGLVAAHTGGEEPRFRLLVPIREYAADKLAERGEYDPLVARHLDYYTTVAEALDAGLMGADETTWLERAEEDGDDLRAAVRNALALDRPDTALRLVTLLYRFWNLRGHLDMARRLLTDVLGRTSPAPSFDRAHALAAAGALARHQGDLEQSRDLIAQSIDMWREIDHPRGLAMALNSLGISLLRLGDGDGAESAHRASLAFYRGAGSPLGIAFNLANLAEVALARSDLEEADHRAREAVSIFRREGNAGMVSATLCTQGAIALRRGYLEEAQQNFREALEIELERGERLGAAEAAAGIAAACAPVAPLVAAMWWGAAERERETLGALRPIAGKDVFLPDLEAAREAADREAWVRAWEDGKTRGLDVLAVNLLGLEVT